jgi:hypothetical protein
MERTISLRRQEELTPWEEEEAYEQQNADSYRAMMLLVIIFYSSIGMACFVFWKLFRLAFVLRKRMKRPMKGGG